MTRKAGPRTAALTSSIPTTDTPRHDASQTARGRLRAGMVRRRAGCRRRLRRHCLATMLRARRLPSSRSGLRNCASRRRHGCAPGEDRGGREITARAGAGLRNREIARGNPRPARPDRSARQQHRGRIQAAARYVRRPRLAAAPLRATGRGHRAGGGRHPRASNGRCRCTQSGFCGAGRCRRERSLRARPGPAAHRQLPGRDQRVPGIYRAFIRRARWRRAPSTGSATRISTCAISRTRSPASRSWSPLTPTARRSPMRLLNMASSQLESGDTPAARKTMDSLIARYPASDAAEKARRRLANLR